MNWTYAIPGLLSTLFVFVLGVGVGRTKDKDSVRTPAVTYGLITAVALAGLLGLVASERDDLCRELVHRDNPTWEAKFDGGCVGRAPSGDWERP